MIHVTVTKQGGAYAGITCTGHAEYDEYGNDIVCAAVSALMINAANSLEQLTDDGLQVEEGGSEGGYLSIQVALPHSKEAGLLLDSLMLGLQMISENYGDGFLMIDIRDDCRD